MNNGISIFFQLEVKNLHGVTPPETHSAKDKTREIPYCHKRMAEFERLLHATRAYEMSCWVEKRPFLCLNPSEKSEILAFVCNELLFNKAVLHQIESNADRVPRAKKVRVVTENRLRRLKGVHARRFRFNTSNVPSESGNTNHNEDNASEVRGNLRCDIPGTEND